MEAAPGAPAPPVAVARPLSPGWRRHAQQKYHQIATRLFARRPMD
jgi:hypothetical protein